MPRRRPARMAVQDWRIIAFGDLHFSSKTEERALSTLRQIRELAGPGGEVVFTGDFWDRRGVLAVRHLDLLVEEMKLWAAANIRFHVVPGNHDQVSIDGLIHGVKVFDGFPNARVYSEMHLDVERKIAFIPWREDSDEQTRQFEQIPEGGDWTVFAHAEVGGATANGGHKAKGRVTRRTIEKVSRACYLGHYHKRQCLGDRVWYLGSPFEQNFGEREWPHGVAVITPDKVEPEWVELEGMPRHHRLVYGEEWPEIADHDFVEVEAPAAALDTEDFAKSVEALPVQPKLRPVTEEPDDAPPAAALSIEDAIDRYVEENAEKWGLDPSVLKQTAIGYLAELPEAKSINPLQPNVDITRVEAQDFCALRGAVDFDLRDRGMVLIQGPIGSGKTALADAITWALYGTTSPRKAGSSGSSLRADEVIHDDASSARVRVHIELRSGKPSQKPTKVTITRTKKRGSGAKVKIEGIEMPDGISDQQELIHRVVGLDAALWRTCVFLGQGAVGNFVTDADKGRKELLATAFGTAVCSIALKDVKANLKKANAEISEVEALVSGATRAVQELEDHPGFKADIEAWEAHRAAQVEGGEQALSDFKAKIAEADKALADEPQWLDAKTRYDAHVDQLTKRLAAGAAVRIAQKEREFGGLQAEKALAQQRLVQAQNVYREAVEQLQKGVTPVCDKCGQPIADPRQREGRVEVLEQDVMRAQAEANSFDTRLSNVQMELDRLRGQDEQGRADIEAQITQARAEQAKIGQALNTFARIKANRDDAARQYEMQRQQLERTRTEANPYVRKQEEFDARFDDLRGRLAAAQKQLEQLQADAALLRFWEIGFSQKGIPVLVLRAAMYELEQKANEFLSKLLGGRYYCQLSMPDDDLAIKFFEYLPGKPVRERRYEQLSGGQRRAVELAFSPFAIGELIFNRAGVRVPLLILDEISSHLGADEKPKVVDLIAGLDRQTVLVIDHDPNIQGYIETTYEVIRGPEGTELKRVA